MCCASRTTWTSVSPPDLTVLPRGWLRVVLATPEPGPRRKWRGFCLWGCKNADSRPPSGHRIRPPTVRPPTATAVNSPSPLAGRGRGWGSTKPVCIWAPPAEHRCESASHDLLGAHLSLSERIQQQGNTPRPQSGSRVSSPRPLAATEIAARLRRGERNAIVPTRHYSSPHAFASSRRVSPELLRIHRPHQSRGRREGRALAAPVARLQKKSRRQSPQVWPNTPGPPCAMALRFIRALPRDRLSCPHRRSNSSLPAWHQHRDARTTRFHRRIGIVRRRERPALQPDTPTASRTRRP